MMSINKKIISYIKNIFLPLIGLGIFFSIWLVVSRFINLELILPSPQESFEKLFLLMSQEYFWTAVFGTLSRSLISFSISFLFSTILSILSYVYISIKKIVSPIVVLFRSVPTMSIILLALIWFKNDIAPIFISAVVTFPILYSGFISSLSEIDKQVVEMSDFYKVPIFQKIFRMYIPYTAPMALSSIQAGLSFNIKLIIAAEVLASTSQSMGRYMQVSKVYLDTAELLGWTIMAIILSYFLEFIILLLKKFLIRWK